MGEALKLNNPISIVTEECITCGVVFGMTQELRNRRLNDKKSFYCTNGHSQCFIGESDAERNLRLLREEEARHHRTLNRLNEEQAAKHKLERKLKRVDRGVCPECNRTFSNLARHMNCKHKDAA